MNTKLTYLHTFVNFVLGLMLGVAVAGLITLLTGCGKAKDGSNGLRGLPGADGASGPAGSPGAPGIGCTQVVVPATGLSNDPAQYGGTLITCGSTPVLITNGAPGPQGQPGTPAVNPSPIQLCPGPTTYPNSFPEFAFCFSGRLFAVMWDTHTAWEAEIVPGFYGSTSGSVSCSFTVGPNCSITH